jgi:hypothetical protein
MKKVHQEVLSDLRPHLEDLPSEEGRSNQGVGGRSVRKTP